MIEMGFAHELARKHRMLSEDEVDLLQTCARMLDENPFIVNIGANIGTGSVAMLEAREDAYIISIDKQPCPVEIDNIILAGLDPRRCIRVLTTSQKAGRFFPVQVVDMVFVDGDHTEKGVMGDILAWKPKIKDGGIMVFHDYNHPNLPKLSPIVNSMMTGCEVIGKARYMIAFRVSNEKV